MSQSQETGIVSDHPLESRSVPGAVSSRAPVLGARFLWPVEDRARTCPGTFLSCVHALALGCCAVPAGGPCGEAALAHCLGGRESCSGLWVEAPAWEGRGLTGPRWGQGSRLSLELPVVLTCAAQLKFMDFTQPFKKGLRKGWQFAINLNKKGGTDKVKFSVEEAHVDRIQLFHWKSSLHVRW
jgi:hypothetical protein